MSCQTEHDAPDDMDERRRKEELARNEIKLEKRHAQQGRLLALMGIYGSLDEVHNGSYSYGVCSVPFYSEEMGDLF